MNFNTVFSQFCSYFQFPCYKTWLLTVSFSTCVFLKDNWSTSPLIFIFQPQWSLASPALCLTLKIPLNFCNTGHFFCCLAFGMCSLIWSCVFFNVSAQCLGHRTSLSSPLRILSMMLLLLLSCFSCVLSDFTHVTFGTSDCIPSGEC